MGVGWEEEKDMRARGRVRSEGVSGTGEEEEGKRKEMRRKKRRG